MTKDSRIEIGQEALGWPWLKGVLQREVVTKRLYYVSRDSVAMTITCGPDIPAPSDFTTPTSHQNFPNCSINIISVTLRDQSACSSEAISTVDADYINPIHPSPTTSSA